MSSLRPRTFRRYWADLSPAHLRTHADAEPIATKNLPLVKL